MIWGIMQHLGYNMWRDEPYWPDPKRWKWSNFVHDHVICDDKSWALRMGMVCKPDCKVNLLIIDVGEGVVYPSHPEIAIKGSWSPEKLNAEVKKLKSAGLTVVPKLNFSTCHDFWLGDYARMVTSPTYYKVVREIIDDTVEIFEKPPYFHIGMDEEDWLHCSSNSYCVYRSPAKKYEDIAFYMKCLERHGARAMIFAGSYDPKESARHSTKDALHMVGTNNEIGPDESMCTEKQLATLGRLRGYADAGLDMVVDGSVYCGTALEEQGAKINVRGLPRMVKWAKDNLDPARVKGFCMLPWTTPVKATDWRFKAACDLIDISAETVYGITAKGRQGLRR